MPSTPKPLARMESLEARTLRADSATWAAMDRGARERGQESAEFGRDCLLMGLMLRLNPYLMEAAVKVLASVQVASLERLDGSTISESIKTQRRLIEEQKALVGGMR